MGQGRFGGELTQKKIAMGGKSIPSFVAILWKAFPTVTQQKTLLPGNYTLFNGVHLKSTNHYLQI